MRTIMSGDAVRSMTSAIVENAAVPTNSVESSTARTNRGDLGAPRKSEPQRGERDARHEERNARAIEREPIAA